MQLIDSIPNQLPSSAPNSVLNSLQDIAEKVEIKSNFCISHPDYPFFELPKEAVERFLEMPLDLQNKYLSLQLQRFLYSFYYNGSIGVTLVKELPVNQNLENNTFFGVDLEFYERLHKSNSGDGYFDPGWQVLHQEDDGSLAVTKNGLTLHIEREKHLQSTEIGANIGEEVAIRMPRNLIQNGFYMAVGNAGIDNRHNPNNNSQVVRVYFNLSSEGAVAVMASLTRQLNEISVPFTFKVLYNPSDYGRYDSGVLYFERDNYPTVRQVLERVYTENQFHFGKDIPLFTKLLAPGLSLAEEPNSKFADVESFGTNRCQIIANALLEARTMGDESIDVRMTCIHKHFSLLGIDLLKPYLNASSQDIYTTLNLC
jgi:HopA1 effector protein family